MVKNIISAMIAEIFSKITVLLKRNIEQFINGKQPIYEIVKAKIAENLMI